MSEQHSGDPGGTLEQEDWRERPRPEMFERVIAAVDGAKAWANTGGHAAYASYVDRVLFPFLEEEAEKAAREEGRSSAEIARMFTLE